MGVEIIVAVIAVAIVVIVVWKSLHSIGAAQVGLDRGPDRVRLVGPPSLAHGGDVIDVDPELDHRSCSSESTARVCSAWPPRRSAISARIRRRASSRVRVFS